MALELLLIAGIFLLSIGFTILYVYSLYHVIFKSDLDTGKKILWLLINLFVPFGYLFYLALKA